MQRTSLIHELDKSREEVVKAEQKCSKVVAS